LSFNALIFPWNKKANFAPLTSLFFVPLSEDFRDAFYIAGVHLDAPLSCTQTEVAFNLFAASVADDRSVADASPKPISLAQESGELATPVAAQRPRQYLEFVVAVIFLHVIRQKPHDNSTPVRPAGLVIGAFLR